MSNRVYVIGDLHGSLTQIRELCRKVQPDATDTIVCLGDFGANFWLNNRDRKFKKQICKFGCNFFVVRGNHEERPSVIVEKNPNEWSYEVFFNNTVCVENDFPNIKYADDKPAVYKIHGYRTLVLPGAYSVDKYYRLQNGFPWFEQEQMNQHEMELAKTYCEIANWQFDIVLSHTCPSIYIPTDLFLSSIDQSSVDNTMERFLGTLEQAMDYKLWCFGHYHATRVYPIYEGRQMLMLINDKMIDLDEWMAALPNEIGEFITATRD